MTDYGPGHGNAWRQPEPWDPDDPLFGDQGWANGQQRYPSYEQQPADWHPYAAGVQNWTGVQNPGAGHPQQGAPGHVPQQGDHQAAAGQWPAGQLPPQDGQGQTHGWDVQAPPPQQVYETGQFTTGYDQGYGNDVYAADGYGADPYADPYGQQAYAIGQFATYDAATTTVTGWDQTTPIPAQAGPAEPLTAPAPPAPREPAAPEPDVDWNPFDDDDEVEETHPFFSGTDADDADEEYERRRSRDDDDDDHDDRPRVTKGGTKGRTKGKGKGKDRDAKRGGTKRRSGCACLAVVVVLGGGVGTGGYVAYRYYETHIAPPPDWAGDGTGSVQVSVPDSATLALIGNLLKDAGVVRSVDAFTRAAAGNPKAVGIQGGVYILHRHMSAAAAVAMMLDPNAQSAVIVREGWRAVQVYAALDRQLDLKPGSTRATAGSVNLRLPSWYHGDNPEGFLFPAKYSAAKGSNAGAILQQMVQRANTEFTADGLTAAAAKAGKTPYQILVIASLIQAEAQQPQDFGKVSRVIYNRLQQGMPLGFDSTINYAMGRSTLHTTDSDTQFPSPYNTYLHAGLPPGPIDNPGHEAIEAALHPTPGAWLYFVTVKPGDTRFAVTAAEHQHNVDLFNAYQRTHGGK